MVTDTRTYIGARTTVDTRGCEPPFSGSLSRAAGLLVLRRRAEALCLAGVLGDDAAVILVELLELRAAHLGALRVERVDAVDDLVGELVAVPRRPVVDVILRYRGRRARESASAQTQMTAKLTRSRALLTLPNTNAGMHTARMEKKLPR